MRRALTIIALATPLALNAQTGVVTTHPANPDGKQITMEEAVLGRNVRPASAAASWKDSDTFITYKDGKWGTMQLVEMDSPFGTVKKQKFVPATGAVVVPAGQGFWYISKGGQPKIDWKEIEITAGE